MRELEAHYLAVYGKSDIAPGELSGIRERLLTITCQGEPAGIVGIRERSSDVAELVRLWVPRAHRAHNHGRALVRAALDGAAALGYERMTAVTDVQHSDAIGLAQELGGQPAEPYGPYANLPGTRCIEFDLLEGAR